MPLPWTKQASHLRTKRQAVALRAALGLADADHAAGVLMRFWAWAEDEVTPGGRLPGVTPAHVDEVMQRPGFAAAMVAVGWLRETAAGLRIPKFHTYMGGAAKPDATAAERQRRRRERLRDGHGGAAGQPAVTVTGRHGVTRRDTDVTVTPKMEREIETETEDGRHPQTPAGGGAGGHADRADGDRGGGPDGSRAAGTDPGVTGPPAVVLPAAARTTPAGGPPAAAQARRPTADPDRDPRFLRFWAAYPRKEKRRQAARAFAKLDPGDALLDRMLAAVAARAASDEWAKDGGRFVPHPTSWLNQRRWEDEAPAPPAPARKSDGPPQRATDWWLRAWSDKYDAAYPWSTDAGPNNAAVRAVLDAVGGDVDRFAAAAARYLADADPFLAKDRHGLPLFARQLRRWVADGPAAAHPAPPAEYGNPADGWFHPRAATNGADA